MQPKPIVQRALEWLMGDDTGASSTTLCAHMLGIKGVRNSVPSDSADRGRCIRLLQLIPEWKDRLDEMADMPAVQTMIMGADGMRSETESWKEQIALIRQEGGFND
jgi:hypothetical protein